MADDDLGTIVRRVGIFSWSMIGVGLLIIAAFIVLVEGRVIFAPLFLAIDNFHFDLAKYLIEAGANPNKWDWWGRTPLYSAVDVNTMPHGGRPDRPSPDATTSLEIARLAMLGVKLARLIETPDDEDGLRDLAGYAATLEMLAGREPTV